MEGKRIAIIDKDGNNLLDVVESTSNPGVFGIVALNPDGTEIQSGTSNGVVGPESSTDNALVRFDAETGKLVQNGIITESDNGDLANVNAITLDTTPTSVPTAVGTLSWNADEDTMDIRQGSSILQVGQEQQWNVRNNTASTILEGTPVYVTGTLGASGRLTVAPFIADGSIPSMYYLGIMTENVLPGADGKATTFGKIRHINTSMWNDGDVLYCSSTVAGQLTNVEPSTPNYVIPTAFVIHSASNGTIAVRVPTLHEAGEVNFDNSGTTLSATNVESAIKESLGRLETVETNNTGTNTGDETSSSIIAKIGDGSKISPTYLPSYVDDVIEVADYASLPATGETGKIYVTINTGYQYRWSGSVYVEIKDSGETAASMGVLINGTSDATPNNTDFVATAESAGILKKISWTNVKAFLKTYFDTLYATIATLSLYVQTSRNLTINGTTYNLSADRSWSIQPESLKKGLYAGESISAKDALCQLNKTASDFTLSTDISTTANNKRIAIKIIGSGVPSNTFSILLKKTGNPSSDLNFRIETDSAYSPSGTLADANATGTVTASSVTGSFAEYTVTMPASVTLSLGTKYYLIAYCGTYGTETVSNTDYFSIGHKTGSESYKIYDTSSWVPVPVVNDYTDPNANAYVNNAIAGSRFVANKDIYLTAFKRAATVYDTIWYVYNSSFQLLATGSLTASEVVLPVPIKFNNGETFYVGSNSGTSSRQIKALAATYPVSLTDVNLAGGFMNVGNSPQAYQIGQISTQSSLNYADKTFYLKSSGFLNTVYKANASAPESSNFLGFAESNAVEGGQVTIVGEGFYDAFSGLASNTKQYVSNTAGAISTTPGTNEVPVGTAVSGTCVLINREMSHDGFVPDTRTVNGKSLSSDVTLTASDVGAPSGSGTSSGNNTGDQDLSGLVPKTRTLTINGITYDLSDNRTWTVGGASIIETQVFL